MNVVKLTQKLISIPSYLDSKTNEEKIGEFVFSYLKQFPYLQVEKQKVEKGRFNVVAKTSGTPCLFLAGHIDTVEPKQGWSKNQFNGAIEGSKLYGLGSIDMKGGMAAILDSLSDFKKISNLSLLFYCDEEYDFKGMKKFINVSKNKIGDLAIIAEPTNLKILNTHKGLIEICFSIQGESGHAADPESGNNAIDGMTKTINSLKEYIRNFDDSILGISSLNIAYMRGGLYQGREDCNSNKVKLGREGNNIADFAEAVIDIRPTKSELKARKIKSWIRRFLKQEGYKLVNFSIRHDFSSLYTDPRKLRILEDISKKILGKIGYLNASNMGYGDGQLLQEKFNIPVAYLGPKGANPHGIDECVDINSIKNLRKIFSELISSYCEASHTHNFPL